MIRNMSRFNIWSPYLGWQKIMESKFDLVISAFKIDVAWTPISGPDKTHAVPIQAITGCAVLGMRTLPVNDFYAVLSVDDTAIVSKLEASI